MRTRFVKDSKSIQQKGRRVTIFLQERVETVIYKLLNQEPIKSPNKCSDKQFNSPIVITIKKDQTVKLALDS